MRVLSVVAGVLLAWLMSVVRVAAQVASDQPEAGAGAIFGTFFWIGFTALLLAGAAIVIYQLTKRPNR
jgi:hypothetical protein